MCAMISVATLVSERVNKLVSDLVFECLSVCMSLYALIRLLIINIRFTLPNTSNHQELNIRMHIHSQAVIYRYYSPSCSARDRKELAI